MPPSVKFTKQEIINAALRVTRAGGIGSLTARSLASELGASTRPMFTYFDSMDALKHEVHEVAKDLYRAYVERGLAKEEPELYKLLFLEKPSSAGGGAMEALALSQDLVRASLMRIYRMDAEQADCYFRDLWLVAFSFATLIVTDDSPYTDEQMSAILTEFSLAICKAYKEIPGLHRGDFDRDAIFRQLTSGGGTDGN